MGIMKCTGVNEKGHLTIGGLDTLELAAKHQTPLYVMDEDQIRQNCRDFVEAVDRYYAGNGLVLYASKAFSCAAMCRLAAEEGMGLDVVSGGELYTARLGGMDMKKIYFHGNNKTRNELLMALEYGVGCIVVDNAAELDMLSELAEQTGRTADIMFRIKPGIEAHTHEFIRTGQIDSKFGVALENGEAHALMARAVETKNLRIKGVECHIGSQIFDAAPFLLAARVMLSFVKEMRTKHGIELPQLNLGGGYGIKYLESDAPPARDAYVKLICDTVKTVCGELDMPLPKLLLEPGRSIVGDAGLTLYTLGAVKEIKGVRTYVSVDGGMGDNPRYALYGSAYTALIADRAQDRPDTEATVAGRFCESGDLIQEKVLLAAPAVGDTLAVLSTGAYNYSMASNYNRVPRPPVVFVGGGKDRIVVRRESYEELVKNDVV